MKIERTVEEAQGSAIYHRIADIPNGVAVKTANFPDNLTVLPEATPLYEDAEGLYGALATAKVVETAAADAVTYAVAKGSLFVVGSKIVKTTSVSVNVTAIDYSNADKDVITVDATLGAKAVGALLTEKVTASVVGITGEAKKTSKNSNCFVSCWVNAVVNKKIVAEPANKAPSVLYV